MTLEALYAQCGRLTDANHRITSRPTGDYNCVAWVERDQRRWWEPDFYWPLDRTPLGDDDLDVYVELFESLGFSTCDSGDLEDGYLKIAIYADGVRFQHVAKQIPSGAWSSKAGPLHDLRHDAPDLLEGVGVWSYASVERFMKRPFDGIDPFDLEEGQLILP